MKRLIDADALMKAIYHRAFETDGDTKWDSGCWVRYRAIEEVVNAQPTIESEPSHIKCGDCLMHGVCRFEIGLGEDGFCSQGKRRDEEVVETQSDVEPGTLTGIEQMIFLAEKGREEELVRKGTVSSWLKHYEQDVLNGKYKFSLLYIYKNFMELASVQSERLTDDDFETIRIHLNAFKEKLCNQQRWEEAEEYQRIIDRFISFVSTHAELVHCRDCEFWDQGRCDLMQSFPSGNWFCGNAHLKITEEVKNK